MRKDKAEAILKKLYKLRDKQGKPAADGQGNLSFEVREGQR